MTKNNYIVKNFIILVCIVNTIACIEIYLHTKQTKSSNTDIFSLNATNINATINSIKNKNYLCWTNKEQCASYLIIHGFLSNGNKSWVLEMKDELFQLHNETSLVNVFAVNWPAGKLPTEYLKIVNENLPETVNELEAMIESLLETQYLQRNQTTLFVHCIGHSLGILFWYRILFKKILSNLFFKI
jgi:hypothetical protein